MQVQRSAIQLWILGYLFTLGFAKLAGWGLLLAVLFWPIYLGDAARVALTR